MPAPVVDGDIQAGVADLWDWLAHAAWPLWLAHGVDRARGGFFEALDLRTHTCTAPFRRLRVAARQIYVFAEAYRAGLAGTDEAILLGLDFLERRAAQEAGGYAWRFDLDHRPTDLTRDLYDHAFVLLALSSATALLGADELRPRALTLLAWLDAFFPHGEGGYLESLPPALPRRQNPHMHLLEALLAAAESFGDAAFLARADELLTLFSERLIDPGTGTLPEFYDEGLRPLREGGIFLVEPGHHCEWAWLLHRAQALVGQRSDLAAISDRLMTFVDRHGLDGAGAVIDAVGSDGRVREPGARLWPQTERLKAEFLRADATPARQLQALQVLRSFLLPDGLWHERRGVDGAFSGQAAPASSLYHLTGAITTVAALAGVVPPPPAR